LQYLIGLGLDVKAPLLVSVVSESIPHMRRGCVRDFQKILGPTFQPERFNRSDLIYQFPRVMFEFFSADDPSKQRGARRDILFLNEANNISYDAFRELDARTRLLTIADWNPVSEFWVHSEGLLDDDDSAYIHATYRDALDVIPEEVIANILKMGGRDPNWANVYLEGKLGKVEGLVYPYFSQEEQLPLAGELHHGLDWGFSGDPTVLVRSRIIDDELHSEQLIYETGLTNPAIAQRMEECGVQRRMDVIYADPSEPKSIAELCSYGFNVKPTRGGPGSVEYGHQKVRQYRHYWTKDSLECIKEQRNFRYVPDKDGRLTERTTHTWSHGMDARRYGVMGATELIRPAEGVVVFDSMSLLDDLA